MTRDEILNMPAGKEIDKLIAEQIMGWKRIVLGGVSWYVKESPLGMSYQYMTQCGDFEPSVNIASAWEVIEWMRNNIKEKYTSPSLFSVPAGWSMVLYEKNDNRSPAWLDAFGETAQLAICRAALLAVL